MGTGGFGGAREVEDGDFVNSRGGNEFLLGFDDDLLADSDPGEGFRDMAEPG